MVRRLSRHRKNLVCMWQIATCGYCGMALCDAFEVDHFNECRTDDRDCNLVATCALCHAIKSRHVRLNRDWESMKNALLDNRATALQRWRDGCQWKALPAWLQARLCCAYAELYACSVCPPPESWDVEKYRFRPKKRARHDNG